MSVTSDEPATDLSLAAAEVAAAYRDLDPAKRLLIRELLEAVADERTRPIRPLLSRLLFANSLEDVRQFLGQLASR
jgi:hypothetical protein